MAFDPSVIQVTRYFKRNKVADHNTGLPVDVKLQTDWGLGFVLGDEGWVFAGSPFQWFQYDHDPFNPSIVFIQDEELPSDQWADDRTANSSGAGEIHYKNPTI